MKSQRERELLKQRYSARTYLLALIAAAIVPVWIFAAFVLVSFALSQQQAYRDQAIELARQSAAAVDGALRDMLVRIDSLARSDAVERGDLADLHAEARRLVEGTDQTIILRNLAGQQLLNTQVPPGRQLPPAVALSPEEKADLETGRARVSDVYESPISGEQSVAVARPVDFGADDRLLLVLSIPASTLHQILISSVPEPWIVGVGDRRGYYVTRSQRHDEVTGKPGATEYLSKAVGRSGSFIAVNQFGDDLLAGYVRSAFTGWLYAANVELAIVEAPLWRSLLGVLAIGATALVISLLLAYLVGRMLTDETSQLAAQASALGAGQAVQPVATKLTEFGLISDALVDADALIKERTSELQAVLDTVPVAVWFTYDPSGRQVVRNRFAAELMEIPAGPEKPFGNPDPVIDTIAFKDGEVVSRDDRPLTKAMRGEHTDHEEFLYRLPSGAEVVLLSSARPIHDSDGRLIGAVQISLDITERKRAENQRRLLAKELDHRVKNNLAIVQALVQQSLRNSESLADAQAVIGARLSALASGHDMLTRNAWLKGDLRATVEAIVLGQVDAARVEIVGPGVALPPGQVMALSLAMHELTTNAIKYGALSNEHGRVSITWQVIKNPATQLFLTWKETGGPPVDAPGKRGFGSRLLERITASEGGSSRSFFDRTGLTCELTLPIKAAPA